MSCFRKGPNNGIQRQMSSMEVQWCVCGGGDTSRLEAVCLNKCLGDFQKCIAIITQENTADATWTNVTIHMVYGFITSRPTIHLCIKMTKIIVRCRCLIRTFTQMRGCVYPICANVSMPKETNHLILTRHWVRCLLTHGSSNKICDLMIFAQNKTRNRQNMAQIRWWLSF